MVKCLLIDQAQSFYFSLMAQRLVRWTVRWYVNSALRWRWELRQHSALYPTTQRDSSCAGMPGVVIVRLRKAGEPPWPWIQLVELIAHTKSWRPTHAVAIQPLRTSTLYGATWVRAHITFLSALIWRTAINNSIVSVQVVKCGECLICLSNNTGVDHHSGDASPPDDCKISDRRSNFRTSERGHLINSVYQRALNQPVESCGWRMSCCLSRACVCVFKGGWVGWGGVESCCCRGNSLSYVTSFGAV